MKKHNEIVQKLANLPSWAEKHREELAVELKPELARIHAEIGAKELTALATELPAWWRTVDETTMGRPPLPQDLFLRLWQPRNAALSRGDVLFAIGDPQPS